MAEATLQHRIPKRFIVLTILFAIATLFSELATQHWILELFSHFAPYYAVATLLCALALALLGAWPWMAFALALALWNGYPAAQVLLRDSAPFAPGLRQFTVFHFNAGLQHGEPNRIVSYLRNHAKEIDVVVVLEATRDFESALDELSEFFPYQLRQFEDSPFGIALASKHAFDDGDISFLPAGLYPHIKAKIKLPGRTAPLALYAIHAPPPLSAALAAARNAKLEHIAQVAAAETKTTPIVIGDFNVTPWSPYFKRFAANSGLADARTMHRFDNTWPVTFDNATIGLAIDHSFAHPSLQLVKRTIGPDLGSDHLPVTVTFGY
ncbi:MAG TPA: endonuclease/exonuclease/phosphatase family protein [Burkholderiales bacterium]|nr:endonuclease/exonuclease/phosphatase family protein [Burkholderiales bacterium]